MGKEKERNAFGIQMLSTSLALVILLAAGGTAYANNAWMSLFRTTFPALVGSRIDVCVLCHPSGTGPPQNAYGTDFANVGIGNHTFNPTLGAANSDGTGGTNAAEIAALPPTFPGDANDPPAVDNTPPTVTSRSPDNNATGVAVNTTVTATFSEAIAPATLTAASFLLRAGVDNVTGVVTLNPAGTIATFTPSASLADNTTYTATLTTAITDVAVAGNALAAPHVWTFTTGTAGVVSNDDDNWFGCAISPSGGGSVGILGSYGPLILLALGIAFRRRVQKRKE